MAGGAQPIDLLLHKGKKHLTKQEIEKRKEAEAKFNFKSDKLKVPKWLDDIAKKEFKRLVEEFSGLDILKNPDVDMLALYCDAYSQYQLITDEINKEGLMIVHVNKAGESNRIPHPLLTKKQALFQQMSAIASKFGFTPSDRAKITFPKEVPKEESEEDKLFGGKV